MFLAIFGNLNRTVVVTNISANGFWLLVGDRELFVSFENFPWFRDVPVGQLVNVELPQPHHLYWPDIDVDLAVESIENPEAFPLVSKVRPNNGVQRSRARTGKLKNGGGGGARR